MGRITYFRTKPSTVEVFHMTALNTKIAEDVVAWCPGARIRVSDQHLVLRNGHGDDITVTRGDYIVKSEDGFDLLSEEEFRKRYEPLEQ